LTVLHQPTFEEERLESRRPLLSRALKRTSDIALSAVLLCAAAPVMAIIAIAIKIDSPGPVFYRCRRVGFRDRDLDVLKFRKMHDAAQGPRLTVSGDTRFTRLGTFLAKTKLDEVPQLWNVLKGDMSLIGPRPEDREFVDAYPDAFVEVLQVRPGITGLSQLAFARESEILQGEDPVELYVRRVLPQKISLDTKYVRENSLIMDARILVWTLRAVVLRSDVAVDRRTARLSVRRRRAVRDGEPLQYASPTGSR
jgi:lipopolysaccharide/colanic/teichoic acid biosynthesis glycosyltransferase